LNKHEVAISTKFRINQEKGLKSQNIHGRIENDYISVKEEKMR